MTTVDAPSLCYPDNNMNIYNLIITSYDFKFNERSYSNYTMNVLNTFSHSDDCLEFIRQASVSGKTIFLISSSTLSEEIIPFICDNKCIRSVYILFDCISPLKHLIDYIFDLSQMIIFEHDLDLLTRLIRDISVYYEDKSCDEMNPQEKLSYLRWARKLYANAKINNGEHISYKTLNRFEERIGKLEHMLRMTEINQDQEQFGVQCEDRFICRQNSEYVG